MTWPSSSNHHKVARPQRKGLDPGQVLPTKELLATNQTTPENIIQIGLSTQKLINMFQNTNKLTERQTYPQVAWGALEEKTKLYTYFTNKFQVGSIFWKISKFL